MIQTRTLAGGVARAHARAWLALGGLDLALGLGLLALGLAIRVPYLMDVPVLTDETEEVRRGLEVARGERLPLVNVQGYMGAWNNYLTALALRLFGYDLLVARGVTLALGALMVGLVYPLARSLGLGRAGALLAALLVAVNGPHVVMAGHIAWSNSTTPFYTTLALALVARAAHLARPRYWLVAAGLVGGIALQTHPLAALALAPVAVFGALAGHRQGWLWSRWTALALAAFLLAYSPLLVYNVASGLGGVQDALRLRSDYESGEPLTLEVYLRNLQALPVGLAQILAGSFVPPDEALDDWALLPAGALALAGLGWAVRRGLWLPAGSVGLAALLLPLVNPRYSVVTDSRYLLPLLPLLMVAQAGLLEAAGRRALEWLREERRGARLAGAGVGLAAAFMAGGALALPAQRLYEYETTTKPYNTELQRFADGVLAARQPGEPILIDDRIRLLRKGSRSRYRPLTLMLDFAGAPPENVELDELGRSLPQRPEPSLLLISAPEPNLKGNGIRHYSDVDINWSRLEGEVKIRVYRVYTRVAG